MTRSITHQQWRDLVITPDLERTYRSELSDTSQILNGLIIHVGESFDAVMKLGIQDAEMSLRATIAIRDAFCLGVSIRSVGYEPPKGYFTNKVRTNILDLMNSSISDYSVMLPSEITRDIYTDRRKMIPPGDCWKGGMI